MLSGPTGHRRSVTGLEVLPSSGNLVSCSLDGQLLVWDYLAGTVIKRWGRREHKTHACAYYAKIYGCLHIAHRGHIKANDDDA